MQSLSRFVLTQQELQAAICWWTLFKHKVLLNSVNREASSCGLCAGTRGPTPATSGPQPECVPQEAEAHRPAQEGGQKHRLGVCGHLSWADSSGLDCCDISWQLNDNIANCPTF